MVDADVDICISIYLSISLYIYIYIYAKSVTAISDCMYLHLSMKRSKSLTEYEVIKYSTVQTLCQGHLLLCCRDIYTSAYTTLYFVY